MYSVTATSLVLLLPYTYHILLDPTLTGSFPSCGICFSFLQLILSHQNFTRVRNLYCGRHCTTASARLFLCRRSRQGRRRLSTFCLSRQRLHETRTSPLSQPVRPASHSQSPPPQTTPISSSSSSATLPTPAPTSQLGKRAGPANSHVDNNKNKKKTSASSTSCTSTSWLNPQHPWYDSGYMCIYSRIASFLFSRLHYLDWAPVERRSTGRDY